MMPAKASPAIDTEQAAMNIPRCLRTYVQDFIEGLRAGIDVLLWGQAYPRTYPLPRKNHDAHH